MPKKINKEADDETLLRRLFTNALVENASLRKHDLDHETVAFYCDRFMGFFSEGVLTTLDGLAEMFIFDNMDEAGLIDENGDVINDDDDDDADDGEVVSLHGRRRRRSNEVTEEGDPVSDSGEGSDEDLSDEEGDD